MDIRRLVRALRRGWLVIAILTLVGIGLGAGATLLQPPRFTATAQVFVSTGSASSVTDLSQGTTFSQEAVRSYANIVTTPFVLDDVISRLSLAITPEDLANTVSVTTPADTAILQITVTQPSAAGAAQIANAITTRLQQAVVDLTPDSASESTSVKVTQIQDATSAEQQSSPTPLLNVAAGTVAGLLVGTLVALLRERLDTRVRGVADVERVAHLPLLGTIAHDPEAATRPLVTHSAPRAPRAEAFRVLRTNLQFLDVHSGPTGHAFVITSSVPSEGKSTTVTNLAIVAAEAGQRVIIVDADLRRPRVAEYLSIDGSVGLTDVLIGTSTLDDATQEWGTEGLKVLPAGSIPPNPSELLQSDSMVELLAQLKQRFDIVLFDSPPLLPVTDAAILAARADGGIVVCGSGRVRTNQIEHAINALRQINARVFGVVLTMAPTKGPDTYAAYGYGYSYDYSSPHKGVAQ